MYLHILACILVTTVFSQQLTWHVLDGNPGSEYLSYSRPSQRSSFGFEKKNNDMYIFGGHGLGTDDTEQKVGYLNDLWVYNTKNWTCVTNLYSYDNFRHYVNYIDHWHVRSEEIQLIQKRDSYPSICNRTIEYNVTELVNTTGPSNETLWVNETKLVVETVFYNCSIQFYYYENDTVFPYAPHGRAGPGLFLIDDSSVLLYGGTTGSSYFAYIDEYDFSIKNWVDDGGNPQRGVDQQASSIHPGARAYFTVFSNLNNHAAGTFVVFGGDGIDNTGSAGCLGDTWTYTPTTQSWGFISGSSTKDFSGTVVNPSCRSSASHWIHSGVGYLFGGITTSGALLNDIWTYDGTNGWNNLFSNVATGNIVDANSFSSGNIPAPRQGAFSWHEPLDDNYIYIFGGKSNNDQLCSGMWIYNVDWNNWRPAINQNEICGANVNQSSSHAGSLSHGRTYLNQNGHPSVVFGASLGKSPFCSNAMLEYTSLSCHGKSIYDEEHCNNRRGQCVSPDNCECSGTLHGMECYEDIRTQAQWNSAGDVLTIPWDIDTRYTVHDLYPPCSTVIFDTSQLRYASCSFVENAGVVEELEIVMHKDSALCTGAIRIQPLSDPSDTVTVTILEPVGASAPAITLVPNINNCENSSIIGGYTNPSKERPLQWEWTVTEVGSEKIVQTGDTDNGDEFAVNPQQTVVGSEYEISVKVMTYCDFAESEVATLSCVAGKVEEENLSDWEKFSRFLTDNVDYVVLGVVVIVALVVLFIFFCVLGLMCLRLRKSFFGGIGGGRKRLKNDMEMDDLEYPEPDMELPISDAVFNLKRQQLRNFQTMNILFPGVAKARAMFAPSKDERKYVTVKIFNSTYVDDFDKFFQELETQTKRALKISHPNISTFFGSFRSYPRCGLVEESSARRLDVLVRLHGQHVPVKKKLIIIRGVVSGIIGLHAEGFIHHDLRAEAIFFATDNTVKVGDYVLNSFVLEQRKERLLLKYGCYYQAPERVRGDEVNPKADVFAFGMIMWEIMHGKIDPFAADAHAVAVSNISEKLANDKDFLPVMSENVKKETPELAKVVVDCLNNIPFRRPHFDALDKKLEKMLEENGGGEAEEREGEEGELKKEVKEEKKEVKEQKKEEKK